MTARHETKNPPSKLVANATQVRPGVYVANSSTSVFITTQTPPDKK
jgi:hypothetical protein